ncbi:MAG: molybdate ABC transporter substrate-binding protein [Actinobacteria bacterium]|nr:MAG: molybdate ABC transporter substrate-binding protein [Actinomycetota bacterium]
MPSRLRSAWEPRPTYSPPRTWRCRTASTRTGSVPSRSCSRGTRSNPAGIGSVYDLRESGVKIVIAAQGVPVGSYTLQVLRNMNLTSVLSNVVSRESDVREVLAKVALDEADAGFVYSTDARTVPSKVRAIKIPAWAQPKVQYGICVVTASSHKAAARAFVKRVLGPTGQRILVHHGFLPRIKPRP